MTNEKLTSAIDKVAKLRALAERATTQAERETAYAQAEAIIAKYQIDAAQIDAATNAPAAEEIEEGEEHLWIGRQRTTWVGILGGRLATLHGCAVIWRGIALVIAGRPSDMAIVRYMFAWLHLEIARLSEQEHGRGNKNAFRIGAVLGAIRAMKGAQEKEIDAAAPVQGQSVAMVLKSRHEQALGSFGKVRKSGPLKVGGGTGGALARGIAAGENLAPRAGLTGGGHRMLGSGS